MIVALALDGTHPTDQFAFTQLQVAHRARGGAKVDEQRLPKAERRQDAVIVRAMAAISVPGEGEAPKAGYPDGRFRVLKPEPVALTLELPEFERLQKFFDADSMLWNVVVVDAIEDFSQRMSAAVAKASV